MKIATQTTKQKNHKAGKKKTEKEVIDTSNKNKEKIIEKEKQRERTIQEKRKNIKEALQSQLISQGKFGKQFDDMVEDYLYLVVLKEKLKNDIDDNGIRYESTGGNGFKTLKPNESCERLLKTNAQMLKILQDLELKAPDEDNGDEGDDLL